MWAQSFANKPCLPTVSPSPCCNILYAIMRLMKCWTSPHPCLRTNEPFGDAPTILSPVIYKPVFICEIFRNRCSFWSIAQLFPGVLFPLSQLVWHLSPASNSEWPYRRIDEGDGVKHEIVCSNFWKLKGIKVAPNKSLGQSWLCQFHQFILDVSPMCYYFSFVSLIRALIRTHFVLLCCF